MTRRTPLLAISLVVLAACQNTGLPTGTDPTVPLLSMGADDTPTFLSNAVGAPSLAVFSVSFWAVKGETRRASIYYHARPGNPDSTELVRIKVDKRSLLNYPNGQPFADGDSVLITMTVSDSTNLIVDFQPSGLQFDPKRQARLWFKWTETEPDLNGDGVVDALDLALQQTFAIWRQETSTSPWEGLESEINPLTEQVEAKITGFTRYAVMY